MFEQLEAVRARYYAITERLSDPAVHADLKELQRLSKEQAQLRDLVTLYEAYRRAERAMTEARELAEHERDPEMQAYARQEFEKQQAERDRLEGELKQALVPKDPTDDKDVIIEIRQGTGGDEAGLFAADLFRMYSRYAESRRWKVDLLSENVTERGGFKEVVFVRSKVTDKGSPLKASLRGPWPIWALQPGERVVTQGVPMLTVALRDLLAKADTSPVQN